jgi:hypothetical protein
MAQARVSESTCSRKPFSQYRNLHISLKLRKDGMGVRGVSGAFCGLAFNQGV